jgi:hypothetical protein
VHDLQRDERHLREHVRQLPSKHDLPAGDIFRQNRLSVPLFGRLTAVRLGCKRRGDLLRSVSSVRCHDGDLWERLSTLQRLHGDRHDRHLYAHVQPAVYAAVALHAKRPQRGMYLPVNMEV